MLAQRSQRECVCRVACWWAVGSPTSRLTTHGYEADSDETGTDPVETL